MARTREQFDALARKVEHAAVAEPGIIAFIERQFDKEVMDYLEEQYELWPIEERRAFIDWATREG
jgi:hypothetical protein